MRFKWVSIAAKTHRNPMADNLGFVQQSRNLAVSWKGREVTTIAVTHNLPLADGQ
jgi:hypothetical protein